MTVGLMYINSLYTGKCFMMQTYQKIAWIVGNGSDKYMQYARNDIF